MKKQLGFEIYDGKVTKDGLNVIDLLTKKTEDKTSTVRWNRMKLGGMEKEVELRRSKKLMGDEGGISEVESGSVSGPRSKSIDEDQPLSKKKTIKL